MAGIRIAFRAVSVCRRVKWAGWRGLGAAPRVPPQCRQDGGRGRRRMGDDLLLLPGWISTPEQGPLQPKDGTCLSAEGLVSENHPRLEFLSFPDLELLRASSSRKALDTVTWCKLSQMAFLIEMLPTWF